MTRIVLNGLIGSHPLGALASFGLLRVLSAQDPTTRLLFVEQDDWIAAIESSFSSEEALLGFMGEWMSARKPLVLGVFGDDDVRVAPSRFHEMLANTVFDPEQIELMGFLLALAADGAKDNSKGLVKPSPFYMASGQQSFVDTFRKIHAEVRRGNLWSEALFGPWTYATKLSGAGWDPGTERMHALRYKAPSKDTARNSCVAGAVWLGFEALPLFPTFSENGRVHTLGWLERDNLDHWRWALPTAPTGLDTLRVLLASKDVGAKTVRRREGLGAIYESTRHEFGQGYAIFRPARRLA
jgi:hypothetical protein